MEDDPETLALRAKINQLLMGSSAPEEVKHYPREDDSAEVQHEVRQIIKSCLQIEDEAALLKNKTLKKSDLLYQSPPKPKKQTFLTQQPEPKPRVQQQLLATADQ